MKTIAYTCSYEQNSKTASLELNKQSADIKNFCKIHQIEINEFFVETSFRDDFKPVLLNIMSNYFGVADRLIITNPSIISKNEDFREWIVEEFGRIKIEIIYIEETPKTQDDFISNQKLSTLTEKIKNIPSLPEIITKSIEIMQDKNASTQALSKIISNDIGLTARVLKLVNSSYYGFPKQISTINQAIVVLGYTTIKGVILSASIFKMFDQKGSQSFDYKNFWKHSLLVATGARLLAQKCNIYIDEDIFSAAFLHDIGKIIFAQYDWQNYSKIYNLKDLNEKEYLQKEEKECGLNHCEIANMIAYSWNLPEIFCDIITYHHNPLQSQNYKQECTVVYLVNKIVTSILSNENLSFDKISLDLLEKFEISNDNINIVHRELETIAKDIIDINSFFE